MKLLSRKTNQTQLLLWKDYFEFGGDSYQMYFPRNLSRFGCVTNICTNQNDRILGLKRKISSLSYGLK